MKPFNLSIPCISLFAAILFSAVAVAEEDGKSIFDSNCSACHMNGGNLLSPNKTLSKEHLEQNGRYSADAVYQVLKKGVEGTAMVSFDGRLNEEQLRAVTSYVIEQAGAGWPQPQ